MDNVSDWPISAFKHNDTSIYDPRIKWFYCRGTQTFSRRTHIWWGFVFWMFCNQKFIKPMTRSSNGGLFSFCWRTVDSSHWREMNRFSISFDFLAWITHMMFVSLKDNFSSRETRYTLITDINVATASARKRSFKKKGENHINLVWCWQLQSCERRVSQFSEQADIQDRLCRGSVWVLVSLVLKLPSSWKIII